MMPPASAMYSPRAACCCIVLLLCVALHGLNGLEDETASLLLGDEFGLPKIFSGELKEEDLKALAKRMDDQVKLFQERLQKLNRAPRLKRDIVSSLTTELKRENLKFDISNDQELPAMALFVWNDERFCVLGDRIYSISDGKTKPFLSGLPIEDGDIAQPYVFEEAVFIAIINKNSGILRLYLLKSPGWTTMVPIQRIVGKQIEDCKFFDSDGSLYMALAVQSEASDGMELTIFAWSGNTMDAIQSAKVEGLRSIAIIRADQIHIVLLQKSSIVQLWRFGEDYDDLQLIDQEEVQVPRILQLETFFSNGKWYVLLAGSERSYLFRQQDERLIMWQVLQHDLTNSESSWAQVYKDSGNDNNDSVILVFQPSTSQRRDIFEIFVSDSSDVFAPLPWTSTATTLSIPKVSLAIAQDLYTIRIYTVSADAENNFRIGTLSLRLDPSLQRPSSADPLLECLSDVERLVEQLQSTSRDQVVEMKNNLVHYKDDVNSEIALTVNQASYASSSYERIEVLQDFDETSPIPRDIEDSMVRLKKAIVDTSNEMESLLISSGRGSFTGQLTILGSATVENMSVNSLNTDVLNDQNWRAFNEQAWRYSLPELSLSHNVNIEKITAENVAVHRTLGGSSPSNWLLKTGGRLSGKLGLVNLAVESNIILGKNQLNRVKLDEVADAKSSESVAGEKNFRSIMVDNFANITLINNRDFIGWAHTTITHRNDIPVKIPGTVRVIGSVNVADAVSVLAINGINIHDFSSSVASKNYNNAIKGNITFSQSLRVKKAVVESINGVHTDELLSVSADQVVKAKVKIVETIEAEENLICDDINGVNFDDFVYANETVFQEVEGPVHFSKQVIASRLEIVQGSLNGLNISILDPPILLIQSPIAVNGDVSAAEVKVKVVNGLALDNLRTLFWTKSTNQIVNSKISMPSEVMVEGNVTTQTFLGKILNDDFLLTATNQVLLRDVTFDGDVTFQNAEVENLTDASGVSLQALDEEVVKKTGDFNVLGNKIVDELRVNGNLRVEKDFNNLRIPEDVMLLNKPQMLKGINFINDVRTTSDVFSTGGDITIDEMGEIILNDFLQSAALIDEDATMPGVTNFNEHVDTGNAEVKDSLNGVDVQEIFKNGIKISKLNLLQLPSLRLIGNAIFNDSVEVIMVNGYRVEENFSEVVNMSKPDTISGIKKANFVRSHNASIVRFNDRSMDLSTVLTMTTDQTLRGKYVLKGVTAGNVDVQAINGRNLSEFIKISKTGEIQHVRGSATMEHLTVKAPLKIESRILNQCNVTEYLDLTEFKKFDNLRIENGSLNMENPFKTNPLMAKIATKTVRTDKAQDVDGAITFNTSVTVKRLDVLNDRMGSVDLRAIFNESLLKTGDQVLNTVYYTDEVKIAAVSQAQNLEIIQWNGADVQEALEDVAIMGSLVKVTAEKSFLGDFEVLNRFDVKGNLNGVNPSSLIKITDHDDVPDVQFTSLLVKNMTVETGIIDGVNLKNTLGNRIPLVGDVSIKSSFTFTDTVHADVVALEMINTLNVSEIVLKTVAPGQIITGQKTLAKSLVVTGDISVSLLNGRNPDERSAYVVLKDRDATFEYPLVFNNDATVLQQVCAETYDGENMTALLKNVSAVSQLDTIPSGPARLLLTKLQQTRNYFADFQFFEQFQQISLGFPAGSNITARLHHCQLRTRKQSSSAETTSGVLIATHSTDGNSCQLSKRCRCHRSAIASLDSTGRLNTLRMPMRLKKFFETKIHYGDRVRLLSSNDYLFAFAIETLPGCLSEKVSITVLHGVMFEVLAEETVEFKDVVLDIASETDNEGIIHFAIMKTTGVDIFSFDGRVFKYRQTLATAKPAALALVRNSRKIFLAIATHGLEAVSSVWLMEDDKNFVELKEIATVGATDVIFTRAEGGLFLTFAQDPSSIAPYTENWSQLKVPAQVYLLSKTTNTFDLVQQLDIDRVVSLTNLEIHEEPFIAAASSNGEVRIYRLVPGQGFQAEQTFKIPGIKSIAGYVLQNETYLATMTEFVTAVHVARLRGLQKPLAV